MTYETVEYASAFEARAGSGMGMGTVMDDA